MNIGFEYTINQFIYWGVVYVFLYYCYFNRTVRIIGFLFIGLIFLSIFVKKFITVGMWVSVGTEMAYALVVSIACIAGNFIEKKVSKQRELKNETFNSDHSDKTDSKLDKQKRIYSSFDKSLMRGYYVLVAIVIFFSLWMFKGTSMSLVSSENPWFKSFENCLESNASSILSASDELRGKCACITSGLIDLESNGDLKSQAKRNALRTRCSLKY